MTSTRFFSFAFALWIASLLNGPNGKTMALPVDKLKMQCRFEEQTEYYGKSFSKLIVDDPGKCCDACRENPNCKVWTYRLPSHKDKPKTCWLMKGERMVNQVNQGEDVAMVSGINALERWTRANYTIEYGVNIEDKNLLMLKVVDEWDCLDNCLRFLMCMGTSFDSSTRKCNLKRGLWGKKKKKNSISAYITNLG